MPREPADPNLVQVEGPNSLLVERLREPLRQALADRGSFYRVHIDVIGRNDEVMVCIIGSRGRLPLIFSGGALEPGHVFRVVRDAVDEMGF